MPARVGDIAAQCAIRLGGCRISPDEHKLYVTVIGGIDCAMLMYSRICDVDDMPEIVVIDYTIKSGHD